MEIRLGERHRRHCWEPRGVAAAGRLGDISVTSQGGAAQSGTTPGRCSCPPWFCTASTLSTQPSRATHHRLGCKHVFVPELEIFDIFQDDLLVFPALEEVGAADDGGGSRGLVALDVHRGGLVVGLDPPGEDRAGLVGWRRQQGQGDGVGAMGSTLGSLVTLPHPRSAGGGLEHTLVPRSLIFTGSKQCKR